MHIKKMIYIFRGFIIRIKNHGRVTFPIQVRLGKQTNIFTSSGKIQIGYGFITAPNTYFSAIDGGEMCIGDRVFVNRNCIFVCRKKIVVGDNCSFGPNVCMYDHDHIYNQSGLQSGYNYGEIIIGNHVWIGAGTIILRGTQIGDGSVIGAGCVLKGYIPPHSLVTLRKDLIIKEIKDAE